MKTEIIKRIIVVLVMAAVEVYTIHNYQSGKTDMSMLIACSALMLYMTVSMVRQIIAIWRSE